MYMYVDVHVLFVLCERVARARQAQVVARAGRSLARIQGGWRRSKWWHWQGEALHGCMAELSRTLTHATRTCLRHHLKLILESLSQPPCQRLIWDETPVIHTMAMNVRPDVRPRKLSRRRMRHTDTDKGSAVIHVVHGADALMRTDTRVRGAE